MNLYNLQTALIIKSDVALITHNRNNAQLDTAGNGNLMNKYFLRHFALLMQNCSLNSGVQPGLSNLSKKG